MCKSSGKKWRDLHLSFKGPKIHAVEDHLVPLMTKLNGIGCFLEDFVEKEHQTGKLEEKRTGHMGNKNLQALSNSRHEWARKMVPKIKLEKARMRLETNRKRTVGSNHCEKEATKRQKKETEKTRKLSQRSRLHTNPSYTDFHTRFGRRKRRRRRKRRIIYVNHYKISDLLKIKQILTQIFMVN